MQYVPIAREYGATNTQAPASLNRNPLLPSYGYRPDPFVTDPNGDYARMAKLLSAVPTDFTRAGSGGGGGGYGGVPVLPSYGSGSSSGFQGNRRTYTPAPANPVLPAPAQSTPPQQQAAPTTPWGLQRQADLKPWQPLPQYRR